MERLSSWEIRQRAEERGTLVSGKQFRSFRAWGFIPERPGGGWSDADVERLIDICALERTAFSYHRRALLLHNSRWPIPGDKLRQAMLATIPSIEGPIKKMRFLYRALRVMHGELTIAKAMRLPLPSDWRPPDAPAWQEKLRWPTDEEFAWIVEAAYAEARAVTQNRIVVQSGFLEGVPFEEVLILLMTRQLSIPSQIFPESMRERTGEAESR